MNNQKLKNYGFQELSVAEMSNTTGGFIPLIVLQQLLLVQVVVQFRRVLLEQFRKMHLKMTLCVNLL